ncbi:hypothetical protein E5A73_19735 [Sphingomonas gei]|uniref:Competence protein CoiA-like N-terminal domain-containing protein n=1 Tax=Sphingomonas gei TaxID=1395960 RepID=A0A4S1X2M8_9SPHN|nr:hypothetical protein [Sphingomonas gei]TGX49080.1 hypothetical protein E5A73_19735 [Sphingomonas gei]
MSDIDRHDLIPPSGARRRPCAAGRMAQPVGQTLLKVPFARCGDAIARHVSAVTDLTQGPFHCLDCSEVLTLRQPINKRRHFAHRPDSLCAGETALHRYAKELLAAAKTLTLPGLVLEAERVQQTVFAAGIYEFDAVLPEHKIGSFQPDALVLYQGFELAVEFLVYHAVDGEKRGKVRDHDISMVEIDLSGLKAGTMDGDALDAAILHTAPRQWIHHRKTAAAKRKLDAAVAKEKAERGARLKGHILRKRRASVPEDWKDEAMPAVRRTGLEALIGVEAEGGHWFTVPDRDWQAQALFEHVIKPSEQYSPGAKLKVKGDYPSERDLSSKLPDWMIRTDLAAYPAKRLAEAGFSKESYGSPHAAVWHYLAALTMKGQAVFWGREDECFYVEPKLQDLLHRRVELRWRVKKLLGAAQVEDTEAAYRDWAKTYRSTGMSPLQLIEAGGDGYRELLSRVAQLETMASGYFPKVIDDLCGLPLEAIRRRNQEAITAAEAEKAAALEKAASERQRSIRLQAGQMLEGDGAAWLAQKVAGTETSFEDYAREGDEALLRLERQLAQESDVRRMRIAAENHAARLRGKLSDAARRAFPSEQLAELFLNSGHPRLQGGRPVEHCLSEQDLCFIVSLMPKKR